MPAPKDRTGIFRFTVAGENGTLPRVFAQRAARLVPGRAQAEAGARAAATTQSRQQQNARQGQQQVMDLLGRGQTQAVSTAATGASASSASMFAGLAGLFLGQRSPGTPPGDGGGGGGLDAGGGGGGNLTGGSFHPEKWMKNNAYGHADYNNLVSVGRNGLPSTNGHWYLRPDTAAAFVTMDKAYFQQTGRHIQLASAYRNFGTGYESSRSMDWRNSDHASGGAIDICGTSCSGAQVQTLNWMKQHAAKFGFGVWGGNWGDDGHFSFSAGGFNGWMTSYAGPTPMDARWIQLANRLFY